MMQISKANFQPLYRVARILILVMLIIIPMQILVFVFSPPPGTVKGFFELYRFNPLLGLLSLDFLYLFNNMIIVIVYLALFFLLYKERPVAVILAFILGVIGVACYYPSNPAFEMLTLSSQYFQALPDQQIIYLAAGEALMAGYTGTSFDVYYVSSTICLLLFAFSIIRSTEFRKSVGVWGLISGIFMIIPSSAGVIGMIFSFLSLIPWVVFIVLLMSKFKHLSANIQNNE
ncbi:MAG: hypothetical protein GX584_07030 [Clostridiaceae bacterium]|jgi:hypothetical protein|nr:hypothetical protein [Clostridiaceae bacterium]